MGRPPDNERPKLKKVDVRLSEETLAKLRATQTAGPYKLTMTQIVERGIELAWREIKAGLEEQGSVVQLNHDTRTDDDRTGYRS